MPSRTFRTIAFCLLALGASAQASAGPGAVDYDRLSKADKEPGNWFTGGRDKEGTYYSPLKQIDDGNVDRLGFAWDYDMGNFSDLISEAEADAIHAYLIDQQAQGFAAQEKH